MAIIPAPILKSYYLNDNGDPLVGGKVFTFVSKTNIKKDTFTDYTANFANTNPVILDGEGSGDIWLKTGEAYRFEVYDILGNLIFTQDNIFSTKGRDGGGGIKGDTGPAGPPGQIGPRGSQGIQGNPGITGSAGISGRVSRKYSTSGTYQFIVPQGVTQLECFIGGGGGGFTANSSGSQIVTTVGVGKAGQIRRVLIDVVPTNVIDIVVGLKGLVSANALNSKGQKSSVKKNTVLVLESQGGNPGDLFITEPTDPSATSSAFNSYSQKLARLELINLDDYANENEPNTIPRVIAVIPTPVVGETTPFGDGGDIIKYATANAQGNCSSGGIGLVTRSGNSILISALGTGSDGIVLLEYNL